MREEYQQMQMRKVQEREVKGKKSKYDDDFGTFKIGGENREIKKRTYDDHMNSLVLNPTREASRQSNDSTNTNRQRGKSNQPSSFNIINHSNYNTGYENDLKRYVDVEVKPQTNNIYTAEKNYQQPIYDKHIPQQEDVSYRNHENPNNNPNFEHLENYNNHYDQPRPEIDEAEYQRYYQEYLNSLREANDKEGQQPEYNVNDITNDINRMNINQGEYNNSNKPEYVPVVQSEYMVNKLNNQRGSNIYNNENSQQQNFESKADSQKLYRNHLDAQTKDKKIVETTSTNQRYILKKDRSVVANPYSTKNYDFGGSNLSTNPITNPVNSYNFNYNRYANNNNPVVINREQSGRGERMRTVGNNIFK